MSLYTERKKNHPCGKEENKTRGNHIKKNRNNIKKNKKLVSKFVIANTVILYVVVLLLW